MFYWLATHPALFDSSAHLLLKAKVVDSIFILSMHVRLRKQLQVTVCCGLDR